LLPKAIPLATTGWVFYFMVIETYDDMEWEIDEFPIGFSTPDMWFENTFRARTTCENGHTIEGVAHYWSNYDDMSGAWLDSIDYEPCEECELEREDEDYEDDDEF